MKTDLTNVKSTPSKKAGKSAPSGKSGKAASAAKKKRPYTLKEKLLVCFLFVVCVVSIYLFFVVEPPTNTYYADIKIKDYGTITVFLDGEAAPETVKNFVSLAKDGFYDGLTFHRIIDGFMMQGGSPDGTASGRLDKTVYGEFTANGFRNPLSHTRGTISMARPNTYNSASCQFFIMHADWSDSLDGLYAAFGHVTSGIEIVDKICADATPIDGNGAIAAAQQPVITSITIREAE